MILSLTSPDGLILVSMDGAKNITKDVMRREDWQALDPTSFNAVIHNGRYHCFYDNGTTQGMFIIDPNSPADGVVFYDVFATAAYVDHLSDTLYMQVGDDIEAWDSDSAKITYRWLSKEYLIDPPATFQAGQVRASSFSDLTMRLYVDGSLMHTQTVTDDQPFRMPGGYRTRRFQIEVEGVDEVKSVDIAENISELAAV